MEQQNKSHALDTLNSNAHWGTRALIHLMHVQRLPNHHTADAAVDIDLLYREQPSCFVVVLRENGCDIGMPHLLWTHERIQFFGKEGSARIFTVEVCRNEGQGRSFNIERKSIEAALEYLRQKAEEVQA